MQKTATAESKKEIIADVIRQKIEELNKLLIQAHDNDLVVIVSNYVENIEDETDPIPLLKLDTKIFEEVEY